MSDQYSHGDLPRFKQSLRGKAFIYLFYCGGKKPLDWYREMMDLMTPDVIVVPVFELKPQDDPKGLIRALRTVAVEYARRIDWGWQKGTTT